MESLRVDRPTKNAALLNQRGGTMVKNKAFQMIKARMRSSAQNQLAKATRVKRKAIGNKIHGPNRS